LAAIALVVSEAVGNAIRHGYPAAVGDVGLTVERDDDEIRIRVEDTGVGIDHHSDQPGLGLGLQLIGTLATTSTIDSNAAGTTVTVGFNLKAEPQTPEHATDVHVDPETPI
jgi:anti-sigma regulatory factor (Ser/Thr protein kinase)